MCNGVVARRAALQVIEALESRRRGCRNAKRNILPPAAVAACGAWERRLEPTTVETTLRTALTAEGAERAEPGSRRRELVEKSYCLEAISGSWETIATAVSEACG
jgi:hypothetical protein